MADFREFDQRRPFDGGETKQRTMGLSGKGKKWIVAGIIAFVVIVLINASFYSIKEQEQGVVTTFGKAGSVATPGLHVKVPFIQQVTKVDTTIKGFPIGYLADNSDFKNMTQAQADAESLMITSDFNFVNVDFYVEYRVSDPVKYLYASEDPAGILKNVAQAAIRNIVSDYTVDDVITTGKTEIQANIKDLIMTNLEQQDIGIVLVNISMQDAEPPTQDVIEAFKAVETAKQGKETSVNTANKYANEEIPAATAQADAVVQAAMAAKQRRINEATAQVSRFSQMYEEYVKFPMITKQRLFYETMEQLLPDVEVIITDGKQTIDMFKPIDEIEMTKNY